MIDRATAERIKDTADIVDVVSDYVHLQRRGNNYVGLCPFHNERTPSFSVNKSRNFCHCFSCHKGGSPVNFIMEKEGVSYQDALRYLARKYNIPIEEHELTDEERRSQSEREAMYVANEWAATQMSSWMQNTDDGRDIGLSYLYGRGITAEAVTKFRLGYSLDNGQALESSARRSGYDIEVLLKLGLLGKSQEGRVYDRFRGRVMFPIINASGKVVGFGGRDLKGGPAKYINSPESPVYKKSNELYGIFQAKGEMVRQDKCYLVEGYLDVIGMWQAGLQNVVASSGTALTDGQIALIHRFTNKITLIYDGDAAGIKASLRGIDMLLRHRMEVKVLLLPDGHDPHSFANTQTPEQFREYIESHETDIIRFQTKVLLDEAGHDPQRRITAANSVVQSIASIPDPLSRAVYIQECAQVFGLPEASIASAAEKTRKALELRYQREKEQERHALEREASHSSQNTQIQGDSEASDSPVNVTVAPITRNSDDSSKNMRGWSNRTVKENVVASVCIKYGMMPFCDVEYENGDKSVMNVVEFILDELASDEIEIQSPLYNRVISTIASLKDEMEKSMRKHMANYEGLLIRHRKEETDRIASSVISMQGIELAEKKLETEITAMRQREARNYMLDYTSRILASHEDDEIRVYTNKVLSKIPRLSTRYTKDVRPDELEKRENAYMEEEVTRAILELKNQIIEDQVDEQLGLLRQATNEGNMDAIFKIQKNILQLKTLARQIARDLGDRTVKPGR